MSAFGDELRAELAEANAADEMVLCRELFDKFNGRSCAGMTLADQAARVEELLARCTPHSDGDHELVIVTRLDADLLAGLAMTAFRLRKMAPVEADIRELVVGRVE